MDDVLRPLRIAAHRAGESVEGWSVPGLYWGRSISIPATFVVAKGGVIKARYIDPDYRRRMELDAIVEAVAAESSGERRLRSA